MALSKHGALQGSGVLVWRGIKTSAYVSNAHSKHEAPHSAKKVNYLLRVFERAVHNGGTVQLKGMQSTLTRRGTSLSFSDSRGGMVFRIKAKRGLPVRALSHHKGEHEIILSHNNRYKVLGIHVGAKLDGGTYHVVTLEQQ